MTDTHIPFKCTLTNLNIVSYWDYNTENRVCALCKTELQTVSPQELIVPDTSKYTSLNTYISIGECKHIFHKKCIDTFVLTTGNLCPIDKIKWKEMTHYISSSVFPLCKN